jgi:hypothetical protein
LWLQAVALVQVELHLLVCSLLSVQVVVAVLVDT